MNYTCHCCNFTTKLKNNYERHLQTPKHKKRVEMTNMKYNDDVMNVVKTISEELENTKNEMKNLRLEMNKMVHEMKQRDSILKKQTHTIERLTTRIDILEKSSHQTIVKGNQINTTNNINNSVNNNVNIVVKCFGTETIEHLGQDMKKQLLNSPNMALRMLLKEIHFNPDKAEFQNIKWTNMKVPIIKTKRRDGWALEDRDDH